MDIFPLFLSQLTDIRRFIYNLSLGYFSDYSAKYLKTEYLTLFTVLFFHAQVVVDFGRAVAFISSG